MKSRIWEGVEFEARLVTAMTALDDAEMDRLCACFARVETEPLFIGAPAKQALGGARLLLNPEVRRQREALREAGHQ